MAISNPSTTKKPLKYDVPDETQATENLCRRNDLQVEIIWHNLGTA